MFQEKERMEYSSRKAPDELKNRTWSSIQHEKRRQAKQRRQGIYLAACFAGVLLASNVMYQNSTIVKVNDQPISYLNVSVGTESGDIPFAISEGRNKEVQCEIPMEINVSGQAHVEVTKGSIRIQDSMNQENEVKELDINGKTVIVWSIDEDSNTIANCIITTEDSKFQYVMERDGAGWKLRLKEKN